MEKEIIYEKQEHIGVITLNRPHVHHALSSSLLNEFYNVLQNVKEDKDIRVVLLTGNGNKAFCAGADLKERAKMNESETRKIVKNIRNTISAVERMEMPIIAGINGAAYGGGLELALACDIRVACDDIQVGLTETSLGIIPGAGGTQRLSKLIGISRAKELIFTARKIQAIEALQYGIFQHIWNREEFHSRTIELCEEIAKNAPLAVKGVKFAIDKGRDLSVESGLYVEELAYESILFTEDRKEGLLAFKEKRKPIYKGV